MANDKEIITKLFKKLFAIVEKQEQTITKMAQVLEKVTNENGNPPNVTQKNAS